MTSSIYSRSPRPKQRDADPPPSDRPRSSVLPFCLKSLHPFGHARTNLTLHVSKPPGLPLSHLLETSARTMHDRVDLNVSTTDGARPKVSKHGGWEARHADLMQQQTIQTDLFGCVLIASPLRRTHRVMIRSMHGVHGVFTMRRNRACRPPPKGSEACAKGPPRIILHRGIWTLLRQY